MREETWCVTREHLAAETVAKARLCACEDAGMQPSLATLQPSSMQMDHVSPETDTLESVLHSFHRLS